MVERSVNIFCKQVLGTKVSLFMSKKSKQDRSVPCAIGEEKLLPINKYHLNKIAPITANQSLTFDLYRSGFNLVLSGAAGCGKTFLGLHLALSDVLNGNYEKVVVVRSTVATRNQGFLPGSAAEKAAMYELPYKAIVKELISPGVSGDVYEKLKAQKSLEFISTSYVRGTTINDAIIVVDEYSNLNFHENCSIITRVGSNCKIIFCGDTNQSDLSSEKSEHINFIRILNMMAQFKIVEFGIEDCVRSGLVKDFLIAKHRLSL